LFYIDPGIGIHSVSINPFNDKRLLVSFIIRNL
jgi:hypothetical protein